MRKKIVSILIVFVCSNILVAQNLHYILIENKTNNFYYVKNNNIVQNLNENSFLTLSKLIEGNQTIELIDTKNNVSTFKIELKEIDKGFQILINENNDLILQDILNNEAIFSVEKTKELGSSEAKKLTTMPVEPEVTVEHIKKTEQKTSSVKKIYSRENASGIDNIYIVDKDTIAIFISKEINKVEKLITQVKVDSPKIVSSNNDVEKIKIVNKNCRDFATEIDIKNFSAALVSITSLQDKLKASQTFLKAKCYTVNQVKRISALFTNDNGKFSFFKAAQTKISDQENILQLETELKEENIIEEFKAFVNQL